MASNRKLFRLLMLHGYRQNETYIYEKTGSIFDNNYISCFLKFVFAIICYYKGLRKALKNYAELTYCQAPHNIPSLDDSTEITQDYGWWLKSKV
jgi:hypothetical protein